KQFAVTVMIATAFSFLASFTLVPWLSSRFGKLEKVSDKSIFGKIIHWFEGRIEAFTHWISGLLEWALKSRRNKITTLLVAIILFVGSLGLFFAGFIGGEFFPKMDRGEFMVQIELPKDASIEQTNFVTQRAEKYLDEKPEIVNLITKVGEISGGFGSTQATVYKSEISVELVDKSERSDNTFIYAAKLKRELQEYLVDAKITIVPVGIMGADDAPLQL